MKLTINNIKQFFNLTRTNPSNLKPGMLFTFEYNAEKLHDRKPLIWVLETKGDRVWGLNLHYNFKILADIIEFKKKEINNLNLKQRKEIQDEKLKKEKDSLGKDIPTITDAKLENRQSSIPQKILDDFSDYPIGKNSHILRNYLNKNIRNSFKLSIKKS